MLIFYLTDAVIEDLRAWQSRPLHAVYPIVYMNALMVKMRANCQVADCAIHAIIGITMAGKKAVLGLCTSANEGGFD